MYSTDKWSTFNKNYVISLIQMLTLSEIDLNFNYCKKI